MKLFSSFILKLESIVGRDNLLVEERDLLAYGYDSSSMHRTPLAVAFPRAKEEVVEILRLIQEYKVPVVPRGAGTATTGSAISHIEGLVVCFSKMNRILELDEEERLVIVEPGVINGFLKEYLKKHGLFYPPDPASYPFSTIGGNVATGAGGPKGLKYGTTKDYVLSLEVVLPGGRLLRTAPLTLKTVVNYNLTPIFVGSEGTLGVFTEIVLRVIPLPEKRVLFFSLHKKEEEPFEIISQVLKGLITPSSAEFIDQTSLKALEHSGKFQPPFSDCKAVLLLELDGEENQVKKEAEQIEILYQRLNIFYQRTEEHEEMERLWKIRREISPSVRILGERKISDDVVVPRKFMGNLLKAIRELEKKGGISICCFGHAGDGNLHVNLLFNENEEEVAQQIREAILREVLNLRGSISGEHGIGYVKRPFVRWELDPLQVEIMKGLKNIFDPENLLNPLVKIPD